MVLGLVEAVAVPLPALGQVVTPGPHVPVGPPVPDAPRLRHPIGGGWSHGGCGGCLLSRLLDCLQGIFVAVVLCVRLPGYIPQTRLPAWTGLCPFVVGWIVVLL